MSLTNLLNILSYVAICDTKILDLMIQMFLLGSHAVQCPRHVTSVAGYMRLFCNVPCVEGICSKKRWWICHKEVAV